MLSMSVSAERAFCASTLMPEMTDFRLIEIVSIAELMSAMSEFTGLRCADIVEPVLTQSGFYQIWSRFKFIVTMSVCAFIAFSASSPLMEQASSGLIESAAGRVTRLGLKTTHFAGNGRMEHIGGITVIEETVMIIVDHGRGRFILRRAESPIFYGNCIIIGGCEERRI